MTLAHGTGAGSRTLPDGKLVAYVTGPLARTRLYVRQVDGGNPVAITHGRIRLCPDAAMVSRWRAAGLQLRPGHRDDSCIRRGAKSAGTAPPGGLARCGLVAGRKIDRVRLGRLGADANGGRWQPIRGLAQLTEAHSCSWSPDGRWIACVSGNRQFVRNEDFGNIATSSIWVIPSAGGAPGQGDRREVAEHQPRLAPRQIFPALHLQPGGRPRPLSGRCSPVRDGRRTRRSG